MKFDWTSKIMNHYQNKDEEIEQKIDLYNIPLEQEKQTEEQKKQIQWWKDMTNYHCNVGYDLSFYEAYIKYQETTGNKLSFSLFKYLFREALGYDEEVYDYYEPIVFSNLDEYLENYSEEERMKPF